ncbi:hypothetical protein GARC_4501 [Paraglaciecola arctica BSs20135]|uniref:Uncharacterized protein n=1 Tax=Paraglaciecola arctica BSs20135 TaxID=493475 RepID=K6YXG3_9ALTE|nr:hypothetical protein GARC_4501 [Paraglaciecola arctica BSs20135]
MNTTWHKIIYLSMQAFSVWQSPKDNYYHINTEFVATGKYTD